MALVLGCAIVCAASAQAPAAKPLTADDLSAWLDGYIPYALRQGNVAGAAVVVVKDGKILVEKGYGDADVAAGKPVDPDSTLFRLASVSKLLTWTAVMQLVEQGKLDLDRDVDDYLDFKLPARTGKAVTLRFLMTHSAGFEDQYIREPDHLIPLAQAARGPIPERIYPAGEVPAYSNYGAGLAGYVVERVSGEAFERYVEHHIFAPLGMARSTFDQPVPAALAPFLAHGYEQASDQPLSFENVSPSPCGGMTSSGADMARFMIAILQGGGIDQGRILAADTVRLMLAPAFQARPPLDGMSLGWFMADRNGHRIRSHDGDINGFHSELDVLPDDGIGLFIAVNSNGKGGVSFAIRQQLLRGFLDRYFPMEEPKQPIWADAESDARLVSGAYELSRSSRSGIMAGSRILQQLDVTAAADGTIAIPFLDSALGEPPRRWREVGPFVWREIGGLSQIAAVVRDGKVALITSDDFPQFAVLQPVPWWLDRSLNLVLLAAAIVALGVAALSWPAAALVRRHFGARFPDAGVRATRYRAARLAVSAAFLFLMCWAVVQGLAVIDSTVLTPALAPWLRLMQMLAVLAILGLPVLLWNAGAALCDQTAGWWAKAASLALVLAGAEVLWLAIISHVFSLGLDY